MIWGVVTTLVFFQPNDSNSIIMLEVEMKRIMGCNGMAEIKYEVVEHIGVLSESAKGWKKELNRISWNGNAPKYDIREWAPNREKMGKGVTLSEEEVLVLKQLLNK